MNQREQGGLVRELMQHRMSDGAPLEFVLDRAAE